MYSEGSWLGSLWWPSSFDGFGETVTSQVETRISWNWAILVSSLRALSLKRGSCAMKACYSWGSGGSRLVAVCDPSYHVHGQKEGLCALLCNHLRLCPFLLGYLTPNLPPEKYFIASIFLEQSLITFFNNYWHLYFKLCTNVRIWHWFSNC